jgi:hypothetical protein
VSHLRASTIPVASVTPGDRREMYALFERYYVDIDPARFERDLSAKDDVILLRDGGGAVRGFSTLKQLTVDVGGRRHRGVYSGDTVVDHTAWGQGELGRAFLRYLLWVRLTHPLRELWWFLISKGYKTYLLMANNFPEHWPRHEAPTPREPEQLRAAFARLAFGDDYDADAGVVRFSTPSGRLADGVAPIDPALVAANPRVRFFETANPGWARGDELVCVARMPWTLPLTYALKKARASGGAS